MAELVLVCEDDRDIQSLISYNLEQGGFRTHCISRGDQVFEAAVREKPHVILLDVMMPEKNGLEVCRQIRAERELRNTPIILVSARGTEADRVAGLESGADDYVTKPFSMKELVARVKVAVRRIQSVETSAERRLVVDESSYKVYLDKNEVPLTLSEFKILAAVINGGGKVLTRENLGVLLDKTDPVSGRTIDVHIVALRKKLRDLCDSIETIRGVGYRFRSEDFLCPFG